MYQHRKNGRTKPQRNISLSAEEATRGAIIFAGLATVFAVLYVGAAFFIPVIAALIFGFLFTPLLKWLQHRGVGSYPAAFLILLFLLVGMTLASASLAIPLSGWMDRAPQIIQRVSAELGALRSAFTDIEQVSEQVRSMTADEDGSVQVEMQGTDILSWAAFSIPVFLGQLVLFFGTFFFFLAGRDQIYRNLMYLCVRRAAKLRTARILLDIEHVLTSYLLSITLINLGLGVCVAIMAWAVGLPNPILWGAMAGALNYAPYLGPITMTGIFFLIGMGTFETLEAALLPAALYFLLNNIEANFVTPSVLGLRLTINPLTVFISVAFWLWLWGPVGALMAMPMMLIVRSVVLRLIGVTPAALMRLSRMSRETRDAA